MNPKDREIAQLKSELKARRARIKYIELENKQLIDGIFATREIKKRDLLIEELIKVLKKIEQPKNITLVDLQKLAHEALTEAEFLTNQ